MLDLLAGGGVVISGRANAVRVPDAKLNELNRILRVARMHEAALRELWRSVQGEG